MEGSQCTPFRPLPFYPFSTYYSGAVLTGSDVWELESTNKDLTYNFHSFCDEATALSSPFLKQYHEVEQWKNQSNCLPHFSMQGYETKEVNSLWNSSCLIPTTHRESDRSCNLESNRLTENSSEDSKDFRSSGTSNREKSSKIWRPFSPELEESSKSVNPDILPEQKAVLSCKSFPTILPSTVILGESSVFKAVKKKKYQCRYCDQWYLNSGQLAGHIRAHIGSKPYRCEYHGCMRAFARNEELTRHRRIHSGVKPHQCETCQKRFGRKDHLNKHKKTHMKASEKKIYLCEVPGCKHRYTRSDALTRHLSTAHSIKHYKSNIGKSRQNLLQRTGQ